MKLSNRQRRSSSAPLFAWAIRVVMLAFLAVAFLPALAQESGPEDTSTDKTENAKPEDVKKSKYKEEVRVTARKREENLQEVPVAVTVVQGEALEDAGAADISDLQSDVPNLSIYAGRNQSTTLTMFMRGIGQADPLWGVDPGVGLYLDDVYVARPQGALLDVYDVERIEVLRGPQGTLYGKNTIGGAVRYISRQLTDTPEARLSITPGSFSNRDIKASVSGPLITGKLRGKLAFASLKHDGYGRNLYQNRDVSDKDTTAFRVALDWLPSESVTVKFSYDNTKDDAEPKGLTRLAPNPLCPIFLGEACDPLPNLFDTESGLAPVNGTDSNGYGMTIEWDINDDWTLKSITGRRESDSKNNIDFDTTPARITDVFATYYDEQTSQELQFLYDGGGKWRGVFGAYYFDGEAGGLVQNIFFDSIYGTTDGVTFTDSLAAFGDGSYDLSRRLTLNFGIRFTSEDKNGRAFNALYSDDTFTTPVLVTADYDKTATFSSVSPKLGLDYQFSDNIMGYATLSRGFKSGGFNVRAQSSFFPESAEPFDDEQLTVLEVGVKSVFPESGLILNAATFWGDYTDIQVSTFTSYDSDGDGTDDAFFGNFLNAGDATMKGVELEFDWKSRATEWFGISGNLSYLDASPDSFLDENADGFVDTQVITNAPKVTGTLNLNFHGPAFGGAISGALGYSYRDESTLTNEGGFDPSNPTQPLLPIVQPSYSMINARIGWFSAKGDWGITVHGKNLADEAYLTNGYNIPVLGLLQGSYGPPRTVTATLEYRFF